MNVRPIMLVATALLALAVATACTSDGDNDGDGGGPPVTGPGSSHILGSPQAPVVLVEYADFQ